VQSSSLTSATPSSEECTNPPARLQHSNVQDRTSSCRLSRCRSFGVQLGKPGDRLSRFPRRERATARADTVLRARFVGLVVSLRGRWPRLSIGTSCGAGRSLFRPATKRPRVRNFLFRDGSVAPAAADRDYPERPWDRSCTATSSSAAANSSQPATSTATHRSTRETESRSPAAKASFARSSLNWASARIQLLRDADAS
jgi:hypothetical protein